MNTQKGFTLLELVLVIILTAILAVIASKIIVTGFNAYLTAANATDATWQGRLALERMVRDIRAVRSPTDITTSSGTQFVFTDTSGTSINYQLSGSSLLRNSQTVADGIGSLTFAYYDKNGSSTATSSLIRYIKITLNVTQKNSNFNLTTMVYPRNLS